MGKGANRRKRQKLAEAARDGNLVQAQWGKASASLKPPRAPTEQDYKEKIPASLRRVMAAKAMAAEQEEKKRARAQQRSGQATGASSVPEGGPAQDLQPQPQPQQPQHEQQQQPTKRRKQNGADQGVSSSEPSTSGQAGDQEARSMPAKAQPASAAAASAKVYKLNAFDQQPQKKGKEKKKAYQKEREAKKKAQKLKHKPEATMTPAELALAAQERLTQAGFGETAAAPLKVNLKRKHWSASSDQGERLAKIQKEQLSRAEKAAPHAASQPKPKAAAAPAGGGLLHQARQRQAAADKEYAREAVIEAYRQQKKSGTAGGATMASLGKLVAAGAERMRQEQQS